MFKLAFLVPISIDWVENYYEKCRNFEFWINNRKFALL